MKQIWVDNLQRHPVYGFLLALMMYLLLQIILVAAVAPVVGLVFGYSTEIVRAILGGDFDAGSGSHSFFRTIQFFNQVLIWGIPGWIMASLLGNPWQVLSLRSSHPAWLPVLAVMVMLCSVPAVQWMYLPESVLQLPESLAGLEDMLKDQEALGQETLMALFQAEGVGVLLANLFVFALVPAVCEELFFRGYMLGHARRRWNVHVSVWIVAALFSFIHLQALGFFSRMALGGLLGYFVVYGGSLWSSMAAHFVFNGAAIVAQVFVSEEDLEIMSGEAERPVWYVALISATLTLFLLHRYQQKAGKADQEGSL